ncbi:hypothetical protein EU538_11795 [Candidatus Thorarchaeota archaeon]|nr:MAG: hypothetical protein EU538_11795 [Candidatus Thorarchaeota archaeon]
MNYEASCGKDAVISAAEDPEHGLLVAVFLIVCPIVASPFGSDEPTVETDNAAVVMTGMTLIGIITFVHQETQAEGSSYTIVDASANASESSFFVQLLSILRRGNHRKRGEFCDRCSRDFMRAIIFPPLALGLERPRLFPIE